MEISLKDIIDIAHSQKTYHEGLNIYLQQKVGEVSVKILDEVITLTAYIEDFPQTYDITIEIYAGKINWYECSCEASYNEEKACKHSIAVLLKYYYEVQPTLTTQLTGEIYSKHVLDYYEEQIIKEQDLQLNNGEKIRVKPRIMEEGPGDYALGISVGSSKLYIVKDLYDFSESIVRGENVAYGKNLEFFHDITAFNEADRPLVHFIMDKTMEYMDVLRQVGMYRGFTKAERKTLPLGAKAFDEFFELVKDKEVEFIRGGKGRQVLCLEGNPSVDFKIDQEDNKYKLTTSLEDYVPFEFSQHRYILMSERLYKVEKAFGEDIFPLLMGMYDAKREQGGKTLTFTETLMKRFMISGFNRIEKHQPILMSEEIKEAVAPERVKTKVYLDLDEEGNVLGEVNFNYKTVSINPYKAPTAEESKAIAQIARDTPNEYKIDCILRNYNFHTLKGKLYLKEEEDIYRFLREGINELMLLGEVHVTDKLKHVNIVKSPVGVIGLKIENNMLHVALNEVNMPLDEVKEILDAYRQKNKYYRLRSGSFLDMEQGVGELAHIVQGLGIDPKAFETGEVVLPKYRALYLDQVLKHSEEIKTDRDRYFKKIIRDMKNVEDADYEVPKTLNAKLRTYQKVGYRWLRTLADYGFGGILADDMGLGKTLQVIAVLLAEKEAMGSTEAYKPSLVVCPTSLLLNWESEIKRFAPDLSALVLNGNIEERQEHFKEVKNYDIIITSYELLKRDIEKYHDLEFRYCIADEAQYIKNANTLSAKALKMVKSQLQFALTGTPIENSLAELWSIFDFIMPGYLFSYAEFKKNYESPIVKSGEEEVTERLKKLIAPFILRRLKREVLKELPDKTETVIYNTMEDVQRKLYVAHLAQAKAELDSEIKSKGMGKSHIKMLALLTRLRQLCCHPALYLENYEDTSGKLEQCMEIVKDSIEAGHKILLFSQFTSMLDILSRRLNEENISHFMLTGSTKTEERMRLVSEFNSSDIPVFLISLKAGGTGLNLTGADVVIHYDPWWNLSSQNQATDRAYRIGQKKNVQVFQMITKDSIEEKIKELQDKKIGLTESVLQEGEAFISKMSEEELMELFQ